MTAVPLTEQEHLYFQTDFKTFDKNSSGFLEHSELPALLEKQLNRKPSDEEAAAVFAQMDENNDDVISYNEYMKVMAGDAWRGYASMPNDDALNSNLGIDAISSNQPTAEQEAAATKLQASQRRKNAVKVVKKKKETKAEKQAKKAAKKKKAEDDEAEIQEIMAQIENDAKEKRDKNKAYINNL